MFSGGLVRPVPDSFFLVIDSYEGGFLYTIYYLHQYFRDLLFLSELS